jgi:cadmium resistance protein CadD (predicted permease)
VSISVTSGLLAWTVPPAWVAILGVVPLFLGIRGLTRWLRHRATSDPAATTQREHQLQAKTHSQVLAVALVAMAHGSDNLGIYIPLFAKTPAMIPLYVAVFLVMTTFSCIIAHKLVTHRMLGDKINRYGRVVIPFVLLGLGLNILWGARSLFGY